jgi:hypothetical protein
MQSLTQASPFHEGEQRVQELLGVREQIEPWARQVVRSYLPREHRAFHSTLPFLVVAARDAQERPWVTLLTGPAGFVRSPDNKTLQMQTRPVPGEALQGVFHAGMELGLLGIDLQTRRRNRVNGSIVRIDANGFQFNVTQAFGNCPQYIHPRSWRRVPVAAPPPPVQRSTRLSPALREWISSADTFFIASGHQGVSDDSVYGMDASHRGGQPGFVDVRSDTELVFPDYAGNNHYNTIGNLIMDPRAGLLFVDFERGSVLQLTGHVKIDWGSAAVAQIPGAQRLVSFVLEEAVQLDSVLPLRWSGTAASVRSLRVVDKIRESNDVTSIVLSARDGGPLTEFEAGQHLPVVLDVPAHATPVTRTYSLSNGPGGDTYRISVKREPHGLVSRHLHDQVEVGDIINSHPPAGDFVLAKADRPVVLISAGVGVTPMASMLHALVSGPLRSPVWFLHGVRDGEHHPLADEVRALAAAHEQVQIHFIYSRPRAEDTRGVDYHATGRIDCKLIANLVQELDAEYYLCGPTGFMADLRHGLVEQGVAEEQIHAETFGPVATQL